MTEDIENRLAKHNAGQVPHTSKFAPWTIDAAIAVRDKTTAAQLERYLKSGSGRAFANKHLFPPAIAQQSWTLRECINYATAHNINILQAEIAVEQSEVEANTAKKLIFNFLPSQPGDRSQQNDTLQYVVIGTEMLKMPRNLKKHGLLMPISGKTVYNYSVSTFMPKNFVTDEFIPLVLYASAYIDKDNHLVSESSTAVPADLQADFIRRSPHYYVIGVTFKEDTLQK